MKLRLFLTIALAAMVAVSTTAKKKASNKNKKADKEVVVKPDTLTVADFSYAMGIAQTNGLKPFLQRQAGIDTTKYMGDFIRGLLEMEKHLNDPQWKAYSVGLQIALQIFNEFPPRLNQQITGKDTTYLNVDQYKKGFLAVLNNEKLPYSIDSAMALCNKQMEFYAKDKLEKTYGQNRKDGEDFLAANKKLKDVKTLPSGLQYKIIKQGTGPVPGKDATVKVNYKGTLIDGTVFDTTEGKQPFQTNVNHVIKGWTEALTMMPVGSKWEIYVPQELGYGDREAGKIKPFSALIFEIELLEIVDTTKKAEKK